MRLISSIYIFIQDLEFWQGYGKIINFNNIILMRRSIIHETSESLQRALMVAERVACQPLIINHFRGLIVVV